MTEEATKGVVRRAYSPRPRKPGWWLIVKDGDGRLEPLTIGLGSGGKGLPVFSFRDEAEMFLRLGALDGGWRARVSECGELVSILYGPCAGVKKVVLDPLPVRIGDPEVSDLLSVNRRAFAKRLLKTSVVQELTTEAFPDNGNDEAPLPTSQVEDRMRSSL